jgi:hypothetical protein
METKHWIVAVLVVSGLGYATGRYFQPARVEVKIEERVKEVEVVKHDVRTVIKEVTRPDGTKEKETIIEDRSTETRDKESRRDTSKIVSNEKPQWKVSTQLTTTQGILGPVYGATVERRVLGPIFAGAFGNTDKTFGLSVGLEF